MRRWLFACLALTCAACNCGPPPDTACKGRVAGDLVVTEYLNDPESTVTGKEWIEIFNATGQAIDLKGVSIYAGNSDGSGTKSHLIKSGTIPSKAHFVLGDTRDGGTQPWLDYSYGDDLGSLGNGDGLIGIKCTSTVIDEVRWTVAAKSGKSRQLDGKFVADSTNNDSEANWCDSTTQHVAGGFYGTPQQANDLCAVNPGTGCVENGASRPIVSPNAGELVISEVMADPAAVADTNGEWFEVTAKADVDLNGLELVSGTTKSTVNSSNCLRVASGGFAVFGKDLDGGVNGGLPDLAGTFSFALANGGGTLIVRTSDGGSIDSVVYPPAVSGTAWQVDPSKIDATLNDDAANACLASKTYGAGTDKGTPGAANSTCMGPPDPSMCTDVGSGQQRAIVRPNAGDLVVSEFMANPNKVNDAVGEWFEVYVKAPVDLNGVELINEGTGKTVLTSATCLAHDAGEWLLFARGADPTVNGGLPAPTATYNFDLANTGARSITLRRDGGVIDQITYSSVGDGISSQLSADKLDAVMNDDAGSFCPTPAANTYGDRPDAGPDGGTVPGDRGTPAAANVNCP